MNERYYTKYAVSAARGSLKRIGTEALLPPELLERDITLLSEEECEEIINTAKANDIKLYHFKKSDRMLPRVHKVLGFLKGVYFENLLDVGSGRGVFLLPFMEEFSHIPVTSIDILDKRINLLSDIKNGGIENLSVMKASICDKPFLDKSFDVVTMLEVLEHIPDVESAIKSAVKIARKYIVITVPSKEDDNPEHIHLLTKSILTEYFNNAGAEKLTFDSVPGHLFMIAKLS